MMNFSTPLSVLREMHQNTISQFYLPMFCLDRSDAFFFLGIFFFFPSTVEALTLYYHFIFFNQIFVSFRASAVLVDTLYGYEKIATYMRYNVPSGNCSATVCVVCYPCSFYMALSYILTLSHDLTWPGVSTVHQSGRVLFKLRKFVTTNSGKNYPMWNMHTWVQTSFYPLPSAFSFEK